ncbi:hypothetical protein SLEP1_g19847 [Rubroshorea leprosula]|uniref:Uncharacterized protein n=1 Tax=Rubroshorea leprosula TaxID=152421 RepID=A0AAV5J9P6_9ROSI|nr:hypothetical protein SLEP1_g19847 [Rubroshorea leprosula]
MCSSLSSSSSPLVSLRGHVVPDAMTDTLAGISK